MIDEDDKTDLVESVNEVDDNTAKMTEQQELYIKAIESVALLIKDNSNFFKKIFENILAVVQFLISFFNKLVLPIINFLGLVSRDWVTNRELRDQLWFIADKKIISYLALHTDVNRDEYICNYYLADECNELAFIVEQWAECEFIQHRYPILKDCFKAVKMTQGQDINIANVVVPTLMAQIDGLQKEIRKLFLKKLGRQFLESWDIDFLSKNGEWGKKLASNETAPVLMIFELLLSEIHLAPFRKIKEGLFKNSYDFEEEKKKGTNVTNLNRHKILHGDEILLDYGSKENLIRLFVCIDFMVKTITRLNNTEQLIVKK